MRGANKSRRDKGKGHGLRFRCPRCKTLRKEDISDTNHGGERHASPRSRVIDGARVCGWCVLRAEGAEVVALCRDDGSWVLRDVKTGRVLKKGEGKGWPRQISFARPPAKTPEGFILEYQLTNGDWAWVQYFTTEPEALAGFERCGALNKRLIGVMQSDRVVLKTQVSSPFQR